MILEKHLVVFHFISCLRCSKSHLQLPLIYLVPSAGSSYRWAIMYVTPARCVKKTAPSNFLRTQFQSSLQNKAQHPWHRHEACLDLIIAHFFHLLSSTPLIPPLPPTTLGDLCSLCHPCCCTTPWLSMSYSLAYKVSSFHLL